MLEVDASYIPEGQTQQVVTVNHGIGDGWYADVLLSPTNNTVIQVFEQDGAVAYSNTVAWTQVNILEGLYTNDILIRGNSSMLLTAYPADVTNGVVSIDIFDAATNLVTNVVTDISTPVEYLFDVDGIYTVVGTYTNETLSTNDAIAVNVVGSSFAMDEVVCVAGTERTWDCPEIDDEAEIEYSKYLDVTTEALENGGLTFTLMNNYMTPLYMIARLGQDGPVLDSVKVSSLYGDKGSYWKVVESYVDGSRLVEVKLQLGYVPSDIEVRLHIFVGGVTFDDGTLNKVLTSADFDEMGVATYRFIQDATSTSSVCHTTNIYQDNQLIN